MQIAYHKGFSHHLGRDMEYKRFGHAGRPVVMFPTSRGRFFQYEDTGTIAALADFIDAGRIQIWTLDGIDDESFFGKDPDLQQRIGRHEAYFRYIREEAFPEMLGEAAASNGGRSLKPIMSGCSMGGFHAANFVFRFPELTAGVIALSGVYSTRDFFGAALDGDIYFNSPLDYLARPHRRAHPRKAAVAAPVLLLRPGRLGRAHAGGDARAGGRPARQGHPGLGRLLGRATSRTTGRGGTASSSIS